MGLGLDTQLTVAHVVKSASFFESGDADVVCFVAWCTESDDVGPFAVVFIQIEVPHLLLVDVKTRAGGHGVNGCAVGGEEFGLHAFNVSVGEALECLAENLCGLLCHDGWGNNGHEGRTEPESEPCASSCIERDGNRRTVHRQVGLVNSV